MPCEARVVIFRNKQGVVSKMELACDGACAGGRCKKVRADEHEPTDDELKAWGMEPREGRKYKEYVEKCACMNNDVTTVAETELQRCCQITLRTFLEILESPPGQIGPVIAIILKQIIACEKRGGEDCIECTCDKFRVPGSVQERVDSDGEIIGTAESVVCKCI